VSVWKIILSTLVIFMAGVLTGGLLVIIGFKLNPLHQARVAIEATPISTNSIGTNLPVVVAPVVTNPPPVVAAKPAASTTSTNANVGKPKAKAADFVPGQLNPWMAREKELLHRMDRELDLTPEQHSHIDTIISVSQERTRELWLPIAPAMNKEFQFLRKEIRDQLTDDQKVRFDSLMKPRQNPEKRKPSSNGSTTNSALALTNTQPSAD